MSGVVQDAWGRMDQTFTAPFTGPRGHLQFGLGQTFDRIKRNFPFDFLLEGAQLLNKILKLLQASPDTPPSITHNSLPFHHRTQHTQQLYSGATAGQPLSPNRTFVVAEHQSRLDVVAEGRELLVSKHGL